VLTNLKASKSEFLFVRLPPALFHAAGVTFDTLDKMYQAQFLGAHCAFHKFESVKPRFDSL
jgi:hypothetical protein